MTDKEKLDCIFNLLHIAAVVGASGLNEFEKWRITEKILDLLDEILHL